MAIGDHNHTYDDSIVTTASLNHSHSTTGGFVATTGTGTSFAPYTNNNLIGGQIPYTQTWPGLDPCAAGHEGDPNQAEYLDGLVATTCLTCGTRMTIKSVTGGIPHLRLKQFMEMLLGSPEHQDLLVKDFLDIQAVVEAEREKFKEVEALLDTARKIMRGEVDA